ncbi:molybdopterin-dependent oxidoreductase [Vibrio sp. SS-MA-C1-2]|uniref:molybdopterin-dependent oxidoreductase n=1 Tax=Vibrio sp. SS-MA-C1-2 TaxID=2908646 RepID=UPI001F25804A|nr:molybdopterin-dependent oxidoreductase [Vibrio sp. SS-MA-C1-2]UJF18055.1 molybdopterin-dependent oxidoreductase [Vibrio sp. SS-MA-C1-2]
MTKNHLTAAHWGLISAKVEDGRVISSKADNRCQFPNGMQSQVANQIYSNRRIKQPMIRRSCLEHWPNHQSLRGKDDFVAMSWSQIYEFIHQQHLKIRNKFGSPAIYAGSYGWASTSTLHQPQTLLRRYMNLAGGYVGSTGDYSTGASQLIMPYVTGNNEVYDQQTNYPDIIDNSELVVFWAANPKVTLNVAWTVADEEGQTFLAELKASGKKVIVIDPRFSETAEYLSTSNTQENQHCQWIAPKPNSDTALMLGIAHTLIKNGQHDCEFIQTYSVGFDHLNRYLNGDEDGIEKTSSWAANICDVSVDEIEGLAEKFSSHRTFIISGWSMQRQQFGEQKHWMLVTLATLMGQIGLPGGGFGLAYRFNKTSLTADNKLKIGNPLTDNTKPLFTIPVASIVQALETPNKEFNHNGKQYTYPDIKMIWWAGGNPFSHHQDTQRLIKAWKKPELIIVSDPYWTATAQYADIVLPIATTYERDDLVLMGSESHHRIVPMKALIEPQYQAKTDFQVFRELSHLLGKEDQFTEGKNEFEWLNAFYSSLEDQPLNLKESLPSFNQFWEQGEVYPISYISDSKVLIKYHSFRADPDRFPLKTASGKIEIYSQTIADFNYRDCPPFPQWMEPEEWALENKENGFHLVTPHKSNQLHSQLADKTMYSEFVYIHPEDANYLSVNEGDKVLISNLRGAIVAVVKKTNKVRLKTVAIYQGAWLTLNYNNICLAGAVNTLTADRRSSQLANGCAAGSTLVSIKSIPDNLNSLVKDSSFMNR